MLAVILHSLLSRARNILYCEVTLVACHIYVEVCHICVEVLGVETLLRVHRMFDTNDMIQIEFRFCRVNRTPSRQQRPLAAQHRSRVMLNQAYENGVSRTLS